MKDAPGTVRKCYGELLIKIAKEQQKKEFAMPLQSGMYATYGVMKLRVLQLSSQTPKFAGTVLLGIFILWLILFSGLIYFHNMPAQGLSSQQTSVTLSISNNIDQETFLIEENPKGYALEHLSDQQVPAQSFKLPTSGDKILYWKDITEGTFTYKSVLYCFASGGNKAVLASCDGTIVAVQSKDTEDLSEEEFAMRALGKYVVLDCGNGLSVRYTFLDSVAVEPGQHVSAGDVLGIAGHTGASYGDTDQCGVYVMQDGLMVDPLLFFDIDVPIQEIS